MKYDVFLLEYEELGGDFTWKIWDKYYSFQEIPLKNMTIEQINSQIELYENSDSVSIYTDSILLIFRDYKNKKRYEKIKQLLK